MVVKFNSKCDIGVWLKKPSLESSIIAIHTRYVTISTECILSDINLSNDLPKIAVCGIEQTIYIQVTVNRVAQGTDVARSVLSLHEYNSY